MLFLLLLLQSIYADYGRCTSWKKDPTVHCYVNSRQAPIWKRQCGNIYDITQVCSRENPNHFKNGCGTWLENRGFSCFSHEGRLEDQWLRTCTVYNRSTEFCSNTIDPNDLDL